MAQAAERLVWAVEMLAVEPDDHILEIGRGHGVAVSLVCEQLDGGAITAIDRSAKMIAMATHRNREHVASGNATFQEAALDAADFGNERFDKIFAVHVRSIWTRPAIELPIITRLLKPNGALYLFHQAPGWKADEPRAFTDHLGSILQNHGFAVTAVTHKALRPWPAVCVKAEAV
ncbi:MAG: class I SAM-dependent methyltransferase [Thermomicrobiales bacterium]